jgi:carboxyl-terminal processing protease
MSAAYSLATTAAEVERIYPGQVDWNEVYHRSVDGMTSILDRYSSYLTSGDFSRLYEEFEGEYVGIGVSVIRDPRGLLVMSVRENGPAAAAGVLTGDVIIAIGDTSINLFDAQQSIGLLRGKEGTTVAVTLFRPVTRDTISATITRKTLDLVHLPFAGLTPDSVVYLRLLDFEGGASEDVEAALDSLVALKSPKPRGLILDLRGNPGGLYHEAYQTADLFLKKGAFIVGTESRSRWKTEEQFASGEDITGGLPMAVLVDRGSASAAEIVAGALQKNGRAILVGDTTFGKGLVQGFTRFQDGDGLRLTISRYYLAGKTYLNEVDSIVHDSGTGLPPDSVFAFVDRDPFLIALEQSLLLQKFAHQYEGEIIGGDTILTVDRKLVRQFERFARAGGFVFRSSLTTAASIVSDLSRLDEAGPQAVAAASQLLTAAQSRDSLIFDQHTDYIEYRLRQIAVEHRYGVYQSYARVVVRYRPDIRYAASLLKAGR